MFACVDGNWFAFGRELVPVKTLKWRRLSLYKRVKSSPVESFRKKLQMAKDSRE